jgi:hypothetical protein
MADATATPTPDEFARRFRDAIRVGFNWDRFFAESWPVDAVRLASPAELKRCFTPWYIGPTGDEVAYDDPAAKPMCLSDVPKAVELLSDERKADIFGYVDALKAEPPPVRFVAPTYALPDGQHFILDRNHRLSALAVHPVPFEVTLWNVRGPLEPDGLLDLIHWVPPRRA